jgi:catechol 2,3-dioxygenase-like lactoylglutathione lyase family enzyme
VKRLHVHVAVDQIEPSVRFYSALFGAAPSVLKSDYAKWMLDDPRVNFAISSRGRVGLDHLGIQVEDSGELTEAFGRLKAAERPVLEQGATTCCYAKSEKAWVQDPSGIAWETFQTRGESTTYGEDSVPAPKNEGACCTPELGRLPSAVPTKRAGVSATNTRPHRR